MHDLFIASAFVAMIVLPCIATFRTKGEEDAAV